VFRRELLVITPVIDINPDAKSFKRMRRRFNYPIFFALFPFSSIHDSLINKGLESVHDVVVRWRVLRKEK
jgi:hypothetical protein